MSGRRGIALEVEGVAKSYDGVPVLARIDLAVAPGELVAIVGQSGQGKSVLLRLAIGLEPPDAGRIRVGGLDVAAYRALPAAEKPFRTAMVFQNAALFGSLTVWENVALRLIEDGVPRDDIRQRIASLLERVDLANDAHKRPSELSGGMRKRAAIARALALDPDLVLYDEPTADLDPLLTEQIADLVRSVRRARDATQIVVTHQLPLACDLADRIAVLHDGRIVDDGPPAAIRASGHPFTRAFVRAATFSHPEVPC